MGLPDVSCWCCSRECSEGSESFVGSVSSVSLVGLRALSRFRLDTRGIRTAGLCTLTGLPSIPIMATVAVTVASRPSPVVLPRWGILSQSWCGNGTLVPIHTIRCSCWVLSNAHRHRWTKLNLLLYRMFQWSAHVAFCVTLRVEGMQNSATGDPPSKAGLTT